MGFRRIGKTTDNFVELGPDDFGASGSHSFITIAHHFHSNRPQGIERVNDRDERAFECKARLSRTPLADDNFNTVMDIETGGSYLLIEKGKSVVVETSAGNVTFRSNQDGQISIAEAQIIARSSLEALFRFEEALSIFLDRVSFINQVPIHTSMITVDDIRNNLKHFSIQSPFRYKNLEEGGEVLFGEMIPIYSLYREAQNSPSPFYRLLCLCKIMEGLLNRLRNEILEAAREKDIILPDSNIAVPRHEDLSDELRDQVGIPISTFYKTFLKEERRAAIAHFELDRKIKRRPLIPSSAAERYHFFDVAFMADLCVKALVEWHEAALMLVYPPSVASAS